MSVVSSVMAVRYTRPICFLHQKGGGVHVSARSETARYIMILKVHMPKTDMKLLRNELVEAVGVIRGLSEQLRAADKRNAELEMSLVEYDTKYELAAAERDAALK